ncbi:MAG: IS66 family transposase [Pseudomonadota bacterium]
MISDADTLPTDPDALRALLLAERARHAEAIAQAGNAPIASKALARIAAIYAVEAGIRGQEAEARHAARSQRTKPLVEGLKTWLEAQLAAVSRKSTVAEAIRYGLGRREGLVRFLDDGRIEIDSSIVERTIKPIALNRKNAFFAGSDGGGERWATLASLIETAKLNGIDPQAYLADILARIANDHPINRIRELLPWAWAANR